MKYVSLVENYLHFILTISCTMKQYFKINCWGTVFHVSPTFMHVLQTGALAVFDLDSLFKDALYNKQCWKIESISLWSRG